MNDINSLTEEVFCLKYELNILANVLLKNESERWVPGFLHGQTEHSHIERYNLACNYSGGKKVIDIACGVGKGTYLLATKGNARLVNGFDIQEEAIRYAKWRNSVTNNEFAIKNAEALEIIDEYDLAVSFETVEHLPNYRDFLSGIESCLKKEGLFLISTPIANVPLNKTPANPYHVQEWGFHEFQNILKEFFDIEKVYVQFYPQRLIKKHQSHSVLSRIYNKIKREIVEVKMPELKPEQRKSPEANFSKIEEYTGQYNTEDFGSLRTGYQIILAKKKS